MSEFYDEREAMQFAFDQVVRGMSRQGWRRSVTKCGVNVLKLTTGEMSPVAHLMGPESDNLQAVDPNADNAEEAKLASAMPKLLSCLQPWVNDTAFNRLLVHLTLVHDTGADQSRFYLVKMGFNLSWPEDVEWRQS